MSYENLLNQLNDPDTLVRERAAIAMGALGRAAASAIPSLIARLDDPVADVQSAAAGALGKIGPDAAVAVPSLIARLNDADPCVREAVVRTLGGFGQAASTALRAIIALFNDPDPLVREAAKRARRTISDADLLNRFYAGDSAAGEALLEHHHRDLYWLLDKCVNDQAIALKLLVELYATVENARREPKARFNTTRGPVKGYLLALAGQLAHEWMLGRLDLSHHGDP